MGSVMLLMTQATLGFPPPAIALTVDARDDAHREPHQDARVQGHPFRRVGRLVLEVCRSLALVGVAVKLGVGPTSLSVFVGHLLSLSIRFCALEGYGF